MSDTPTPTKKPARKKAAAKTTVTPAVKTPAKKATKKTNNKGVLQSLSLAKILEFTGGTMETVIAVSKRSLVDAKTRTQRDTAKRELEAL